MRAGQRAGGRVRSTRHRQQEAPRGAAGFSFKIDRDAAAKRCTDAGKEWRAIDDARATCSGVAASVGFEAKTELAFCGGGSAL